MLLCRFYLLDKSGLAGLETSINHFDTELIVFWGIHAREIEYLEYSALLGQVPDCHNIREATLLAEKNKYLSWVLPRPSYHRTGEDIPALHVSEPARIMRTNSFNEALTAGMGADWVQKWAGHYMFGWAADRWSYPPSFLAFALLNGLFLYSRDVLTFNTSHPLDNPTPPLLFWAIASCDYIEETTLGELWRDEAERCHKFVHYLLRRGANPNAVFRIPFQQTPPDEPLTLKRPLRNGHADITALNFALGVILKTTDESFAELRMAMEEIICILVENGAMVGNTLYTNYWKQRLEPQERTILHYLCFPRDYKKTYPNGFVQEFQPFVLLDEGPVLCRTIKTLLDHGADPNAVDSDGLDVLACMMVACPYDLIEYALEKGALISPSLLRDKDGSPVQKHGILLENRWRRPECYTPEARETVRKHMPHWEQLPVGLPALESAAVRDEHDVYDAEEGAS
jgi:hypothetical protein